MRKDLHHAAPLPQVKAELFFGANIPGTLAEHHCEITGARLYDGPAVVTNADFASFLADSVTPHFPGFTLATVEGYWKGKPEVCRVLTLLADDSGATRQQVRMIAEQYKSRFNQEAVAYAFTAAEFTLDCWPYGPVALYHQLDKGTAKVA